MAGNEGEKKDLRKEKKKGFFESLFGSLDRKLESESKKKGCGCCEGKCR